MVTDRQRSKEGKTQLAQVRQLYGFLLKLGMVLYPLFYVLDLVVYPSHALAILVIRCLVTLYFMLCYILLKGDWTKSTDFMALSCIFMAAAGISWICFFSGQGFGSPYFVGLLQVIVVSTALIRIDPKPYALMVAAIVGHHFGLLFFTPWSYQPLLLNLFGLVVFSGVSIYLHALLFRLFHENTALKGILPICAHCKKIRDDEGFWRDVAAYISQHSEAQFSHGLCSDCMNTLYPDLEINGVEIKELKIKDPAIKE